MFSNDLSVTDTANTLVWKQVSSRVFVRIIARFAPKHWLQSDAKSDAAVHPEKTALFVTMLSAQ